MVGVQSILPIRSLWHLRTSPWPSFLYFQSFCLQVAQRMVSMKGCLLEGIESQCSALIVQKDFVPVKDIFFKS
jgi:hypothetical protein